MIIIFDGPDKVGKSTLMLEFHKQTNYRHILVDRGVISLRAYSKVFNRNLDESYDKDEEYLHGNSLSIFLHAPPAIIRKRFVEHDEPPLPYDTTIEQHLNAHWKEYHDYLGDKIELNTFVFTPNECVQKIIAKLKEITK